MACRIAIMQPYFFPYAGYFRLLCDVDAFVALDNVKFPQQGWVHRNRLLHENGSSRWLTLPLSYQSRSVTIDQLEFSQHANVLLQKRMHVFPACSAPSAAAAPLASSAAKLEGDFVVYLMGLLTETMDVLGLPVPPLLRASSLALPDGLAGAERLYAICRSLGANRYVNAPGGRDLYDIDEFARRGIDLEFLPPHQGRTDSILQRLHDEAPEVIAEEIRANGV